MAIGDFDNTTTLAEDYLAGRGGSPTEFLFNLRDGQRLGQAFFNALSGTDQERLRGTEMDPFYVMANRTLVIVIEWLLDNEGSNG